MLQHAMLCSGRHLARSSALAALRAPTTLAKAQALPALAARGFSAEASQAANFGAACANTEKAAEVAGGRPDVKHFRSPDRALLKEREHHVSALPAQGDAEWHMPHTVWKQQELEEIKVEHTKPVDKVDRAAYWAVQSVRAGFDLFSGYKWGMKMGTLDEAKWLRRIIFLETVAGVPGMVGGMIRHLHSLRLMRKDHGWIHTLLSEAENERMHLMIAMTMRMPGPMFRGMVVASQGIFYWSFGLAYLISPRFCHRFVGYLEEEAVKTYTHLLEDIDAGKLPMFASTSAPPIALEYYGLPKTASLRDVFACIRADESHHRDVNHGFASLKETDANPFPPGF